MLGELIEGITRGAYERAFPTGHLEPVAMTREQLRALPEYSCSMPTGAKVGFKWKRNPTFGTILSVDDPPTWVVAEAIECDGAVKDGWDRCKLKDGKCIRHIGIKWRRAIVVARVR